MCGLNILGPARAAHNWVGPLDRNRAGSTVEADRDQGERGDKSRKKRGARYIRYPKPSRIYKNLKVILVHYVALNI